MAVVPRKQRTLTNGTTAVTVVDAPATNFRYMIPALGVCIFNDDTVIADVTIQINANTVVFKYDHSEDLAVDAAFRNVGPIVLGANDSLEVVLGGAVTTTELSCNAAYQRVPIPIGG